MQIVETALSTSGPRLRVDPPRSSNTVLLFLQSSADPGLRLYHSALLLCAAGAEKGIEERQGQGGEKKQLPALSAGRRLGLGNSWTKEQMCIVPPLQAGAQLAPARAMGRPTKSTVMAHNEPSAASHGVNTGARTHAGGSCFSFPTKRCLFATPNGFHEPPITHALRALEAKGERRKESALTGALAVND